jgi:hypothetical protein
MYGTPPRPTDNAGDALKFADAPCSPVLVEENARKVFRHARRQRNL